MVRLILVTAASGLRCWELPDGQFTLGRDPHNSIVIKDGSVSARHCELLVFGSEVIVRERGARNGTFVNGVRVQAQSGVRHGQKIRFGRVEARVEIEVATDDDATAITAMDAYRRAMVVASSQPQNLPKAQDALPVVDPGYGTASPTVQFSVLTPTSSTELVPAPKHQHPLQRRIRLGLIASLAVMLLLILWMCSP